MQRVFIGIPVDQQAQRHINRLLVPIQNSRQDIRWVAENNRHLTLAFLGNKPINDVENLVGLLDEAYQQEACFQYSLSTLTRFPDAAARIIAVTGIPTAPLDNLFQLTLKLLQRSKLEFDQKKFRPHITLARIRKPRHVKTTIYQQINIKLDITKIILFQSTLTESGSVYSTLKDIQLN